MVTATLLINGAAQTVRVHPDTPLLWVLRETLKLTGTKYGCGAAQCGSCVVHIEGRAAYSCQTPVSEVGNRPITTIEGLSPDSTHPVQRAWIAEQVPQCGYCQSGQIMRAAALLKQNPRPTREDIIAEMQLHLCRCGSYRRVVAAVERAARGG
ncbi:MAG: (2Fe-2S)-binding protein [Xanthobacteraceae bacterium]|nr:(2Fe-2S)-binding protein [Xanthobacteraceae bacterium]